MKITKLLFIFTVVSMMVVSCKETKKEEVQEEGVEMSEEVNTEGTTAVEEASSVNETGENMKPAAESIDGDSKDMEEMVVAEGVMTESLAETPIVYPGCSGTVEEIRACNIKSYTDFILKEFDHDIAKESNLEEGEYLIKTLFLVDKTGAVSVVRVSAPNEALETEIKRIVAKVPQVVPATKGGEPVDVSFILPLNYQVQ